jgi:hypothetical protein
MNFLKQSQTVAFLLGVFAFQGAGADSDRDRDRDDQRIRFTADAAAGLEYDSNVNLVDLDTNTGQADTAFLADLGFGSEIALTDRASLELGYDYSQTRYSEFSSFNLAIHRAFAELEYRTSVIDAGIALHDIDARLDGEGYLDMRRVSPSVSRLFGERLYLRGAFIRTDKDHAADPGRSAANDAYSGDAYFFLDGTRRYVALGYTAASEDAVNDDFDYDGGLLKLKYALRMEWRGVDVELNSRLQLERRDYRQLLDAQTSPLLPPNGERRTDDRFRAGLGLDIPIAEWLTVENAIDYTSVDSNLETAAFDEISYSVKLAAAF